MWRRTELYKFGGQFPGVVNPANVTKGTNTSGYMVLRPQQRPPFSDLQFKDPDKTGVEPDGSLMCTVDGVKMIYEPWLMSLSLNVFRRENQNPEVFALATDVAVEAIARFVDYTTYDAQGLPPGLRGNDGDPVSTAQLAFESTDCQDQLFGFRTGQAGARTGYASNATSDGYPWPREHVQGLGCINPRQGYWPLVMTYRFPIPAGIDEPYFSGCFTLDWEWRKREL